MPKAVEKITKKLENGENALIMFVGDSITWGENHCTSEETYCAEFARLIGKQFPKITVIRYDGIMQGGAMPLKGYSEPVTVQKGSGQTLTIVRSGVGGDTVRRALNRQSDYTGAFITGEMPDVFVAMFGINDALAGDPSKFILPDGFYSDLVEFCEVLEEKNVGAEIVLMTPTYNHSGKNEDDGLGAYADMVKKVAAEKEMQLIDTHKLWLEHLIVESEHYGQREWLSNVEGDCCHFSPEGSRETAKFIFNCFMGL